MCRPPLCVPPWSGLPDRNTRLLCIVERCQKTYRKKYYDSRCRKPCDEAHISQLSCFSCFILHPIKPMPFTLCMPYVSVLHSPKALIIPDGGKGHNLSARLVLLPAEHAGILWPSRLSRTVQVVQFQWTAYSGTSDRRRHK